MNKFSVAILCGGLATRLLPLTEELPKALVDVNGEPFIAHQLRLLHKNQIQHVVLCVGFQADKIVERIGSGKQFGLKLDYSFDGPTLLGTAGAIKKALPLLSDPFCVLYGDSYLECDYAAVQEAFLKTGKPAMMTVYRNEGRWDNSNVEFVNGRILAYNRNKPDMSYIDYGLGLFHKLAFDFSPEAGDLANLYQSLLQQDQLAGFEVQQRFYEIGSPAGLEETRRYLVERKQ